MSDARERLLEAVTESLAIWSEEWYGINPDDVKAAAQVAVDGALDHPDDLLAVLVEAGILERLNTMADDQTPYYRRIEGEKP